VTRVVLDAMSPMLMSIVRDVLDSDGSTEVVASGIVHGELEEVARATHPDAIVIGGGETPLTGTTLLAQLLRGGGHPVRIVALANRNRSALLHELRPNVTVI
jgi:chemotaxis response regulator CheB